MTSVTDSGIYTITSPSGNQYVGSAKYFASRWAKIRRDLRNGKHTNEPLQRAFDNHGEDKLVFTKLLHCGPKYLFMFKQRAIDALNPFFNIRKVAGNSLGAKRAAAQYFRMKSEERKRKVPEGLKRRFAAKKAVR